MTQARPARRQRKAAPKQAHAATPFTHAAPRARHDGWTPDRQIAFIDALAESGCVSEACATIGIAPRSAYRLRARTDAQGFRLAWDAALDYAIRRLSDACLSRALHGEAIPHYFQGEQIGEHRRYDNRLAMFLLRYRDPLRYAAPLDQMVYEGDTEGAAIRLAKARERAEGEAHGIAATEFEPDDLPFATTPVAAERERQVEDAIVRSNAPIHGSYARRERLRKRRADLWEQEHGDEKAKERALLIAEIARLSGEGKPGVT
jgi:hypothetical protein